MKELASCANLRQSLEDELDNDERGAPDSLLSGVCWIVGCDSHPILENRGAIQVVQTLRIPWLIN